MTLRDDIQHAYDRVKRDLAFEQNRKVVSRDVMPFEYANGRVMFNAEWTREIMKAYAVGSNVGSALDEIANEMLDMNLPASLTVGYVRNRDREYVFVFVTLQS